MCHSRCHQDFLSTWSAQHPHTARSRTQQKQSVSRPHIVLPCSWSNPSVDMLRSHLRPGMIAFVPRRHVSSARKSYLARYFPSAIAAAEIWDNSPIRHFRGFSTSSLRQVELKQTEAVGASSHESLNKKSEPNTFDTPPAEDISSDDDVAPPDHFLTTIFENMEPYIDTYEVYKQLKSSGFSLSQSDEIINLLVVQLNSKLTKLSTKYSQIYELENEQYLFESAQQELRVDITRNRELHINEAISKINAVETDYEIISDELNNYFIQLKNDVQVAINDQKSDNTLKSRRIMLRIQETNHKITTELNMAMRSEIESLRWHLSRWGLIVIMVSVFFACAAFYAFRIKRERAVSANNEFVPLVIYEPSEFDEDDYHADLDPNAL